jgi:hypothetical protein
MTDRDSLLRRLDDMVAIAKQLDDEALEALERHWREILTAAEPMPDEVADGIEREIDATDRLQQLADTGGRIALDVGDLTPGELELLADSEIPDELRWNSDVVPPADFVARDGSRWTLQRDLIESDDEYAARKTHLGDDLARQYWLAEQFDLNGWKPPVALRGSGDFEYVPRPRQDEEPSVYARRYWRFFAMRDREQLIYEPGVMGIEMISAGSLPVKYRNAVDEAPRE